jgi:xanthine dehydrogenase accessory factor
MDEVDIFSVVAEARHLGQDVALAMVVRTQGSVPRHAGSKMVVWPDGRMAGTVGGGLLESRVTEAALTSIQTAKPQMLSYSMSDMAQGDAGICGGTVEVYVEPVLAPPTVVVIGCGHVGKEVAFLAKWLGFRVFVSDDRVELCTEAQIPGMDGYYPVPAVDLHQHIPIGSQTFIAAMTRGQVVDLDLLPSLLGSPARYIGLIGSRRRWALTAQALREKGVSDADLARIHAPVGLELKAETPREIAVSVLAEIIMVQHGGDGQPMRWLAPESEAADTA